MITPLISLAWHSSRSSRLAAAAAVERLIIITGGVPREETPSFYANRMKSLSNPFSLVQLRIYSVWKSVSVRDSKSDKSKSTQT